MINLILDELKTALDALSSTTLTGFDAARVGDEQPIPTSSNGTLTLDLGRELGDDDDRQPTGLSRVSFELILRIYVSSLGKGNAPARAARDLYWRIEEGQQLGVRVALRSLQQVRAGGVTWMLTLVGARTPRKPPEGRYSSALEVSVLARGLVGR